jgi:hypothetical protein
MEFLWSLYMRKNKKFSKKTIFAINICNPRNACYLVN